MDGGRFAKALAVQTAALVVLFGLLVALPLPEDFFEEAGFVTGPIAWAVCSLLTARILSLTAGTAFAAALLGGLAGLVALLAVNHSVGMVAALVAFAGWCSFRRPTPNRGGRVASWVDSP